MEKPTADEILRRIVSGGCLDHYGIYDDACCYFCRGDHDGVSPTHLNSAVVYHHEPDCEFVAAEQYLANLKQENGSGNT
jgi:hypothetical protein